MNHPRMWIGITLTLIVIGLASSSYLLFTLYFSKNVSAFVTIWLSVLGTWIAIIYENIRYAYNVSDLSNIQIRFLTNSGVLNNNSNETFNNTMIDTFKDVYLMDTKNGEKPEFNTEMGEEFPGTEWLIDFITENNGNKIEGLHNVQIFSNPNHPYRHIIHLKRSNTHFYLYPGEKVNIIGHSEMIFSILKDRKAAWKEKIIYGKKEKMTYRNRGQ